jgi:hypothetical protein
MKNNIMVIDLRPEIISQKAVAGIQEQLHSIRRAYHDGKLTDAALRVSIIAALSTIHPHSAFAAYQKGTIMIKAQPIIDILKDVAEPLGYGMYIWAAIRYIQGQRGEAKEIAKGVTWGLIAIYMLPMFFDIIQGIGDVSAPTTAPVTPIQ